MAIRQSFPPPKFSTIQYAFSVVSVIRGYHEYKDIWDAAIDGLELPCEREPGNLHDPSAVAVVKRSSGTSKIFIL